MLLSGKMETKVSEISDTFDGVCRCCFSSSTCKSLLLPVANEINATYAEMLDKCLGLNVEASKDPFEKKMQINTYLICQVCIGKLEFCVEFKQVVMDTLKIFNNIKMENQLENDGSTKKLIMKIADDLDSSNHFPSMLSLDDTQCEFSKNARRKSKSKDIVIKEEYDGSDDMNMDNDWQSHLCDDLEYKPENECKPVKLRKLGKKKAKEKKRMKHSRKLSITNEDKNEWPNESPQLELTNEVIQTDKNDKKRPHKRKDDTAKVTSTQRAREIRSMMDDKNLQCKICSKTFLNNRCLKVHINEHYSDYVCEVCGRGFALKAIYQNHFRRHVVGEFPCRHCSETFSSKGQYDTHVAKHRGQKRYVCKLCPERFAAFYSREKHMQDAHDIMKKYKCEHCTESFLVKSMLDKHYRRRHAERKRNVSCELCGKAFFEMMLLKRHMVVHTGKRIYKCDVCLKSYPRIRTLSDHMKIHNNIRNHICNFCGKAFVQACSLRSHLKTHEKEKNKKLENEESCKTEGIPNNGIESPCI